MKKTLHKRKTEKTPLVHLNLEENIFQIKGASFAENISELYADVLEWLQEHISKVKSEIVFEFYFNTINSVSLKSVSEILFVLNEEYLNGLNIKRIRWIHDSHDDDILEIGTDFSDFVKLPFEFVAV